MEDNIIGVKEINLGKDEAILYENENIIMKRDNEEESIIGIGYLVISSKKILFYPSNFKREIVFLYQDISYHAMSRENGYIVIQLNLNESTVKKYEDLIRLDIYEKLLIVPSDPQDLTTIFDQISVGSSLNPEYQDINNDLNIDFSKVKISEMDMKEEEEDEEYMYENENEMIDNNIQYENDNEMFEDKKENIDYEAFYEYKCTNTIDKMEKKNLKENDERRFEDAEI